MQVVRVPQFDTLTIPNNRTLTADPWDGERGGVVAVHAKTTIDTGNSGTISADNLGFRGGETDNDSQPDTTDVTTWQARIEGNPVHLTT